MSFDHSNSSTSHGKGPAMNHAAESSTYRPAAMDAPADATGYRAAAPMAVDVQPPRPEDLQPSYAATVADPTPEGFYGSMINCLGAVIGTMGAVPCCFCCPNPFKEVQQGNVGLVTRFGKFTRAVDPGLTQINPLSERLIHVDVKIQTAEVPQQICMTRDNVTLQLTSVIYYHVVRPDKATFGISNVRMALMERTQTTLRHVVGARVLQDVVERREEVAQSIGEIIESVAADWGVHVESMLIKDIIFSDELQKSLSMAAQSKRIGESKIIAAKAEVESAKLMRQAADILSSAPAMQIRYLEAMQAMAKSAGSKVIFLPGSQMLGNAAMNAALSNERGEGSANQLELGVDPNFQQAMNAHVVEHI